MRKEGRRDERDEEQLRKKVKRCRCATKGWFQKKRRLGFKRKR